MEQTILVKQYKKEDIHKVDVKEVWRYAGYSGIPDVSEKELNEQLQEVIAMTEKVLSYKVVYFKSDTLPFAHSSKDLEELFKGCDQYYMFAATLGVGLDRLIAINGKLSPVKALLLQALGAERVEALCDKFCDEIGRIEQQEGRVLTMRFSPGYGDLPLDTQKEFFRVLDCNRKVGISLNQSLLMSPSKSVTAVFGAKRGNQKSERKDWCAHKCELCKNINCEFRGK